MALSSGFENFFWVINEMLTKLFRGSGFRVQGVGGRRSESGAGQQGGRAIRERGPLPEPDPDGAAVGAGLVRLSEVPRSEVRGR